MSVAKKNLKIRHATEKDVPSVCKVANQAYRSIGGWTGEHHLVSGARISEAQLTEKISEKDTIILVAENETEEIVGCCAVMPWENEGEVEIGLLAVAINVQSGGVGSQLIHSAIDTAKQIYHATHAVLTVLSVRTDILAWYARLGFEAVGEIPVYDGINVLVENCHFKVLKKDLRE